MPEPRTRSIHPSTPRAAANPCLGVFCLVVLGALLLPAVPCAQQPAGGPAGRTPLAKGQDKGERQGDDKALASEYWRVVNAKIQVFHQDLEASAQAAEKSAWSLIQVLKRFVTLFPDSPYTGRAYYELGEAHAAVSRFPEAMAYWRMVAKYYPQSPWASKALTSMVSHMERHGDVAGIRRLYQEIVRQFPDSPAAKMAWVIMAMNALEEGKTQEVAKQVRVLEKADKDIYTEVPRFLDLKARLATAEGREEEARACWLHYLNLIDSRPQRAEVLFRIAESYRRSAKTIEAKKYYMMIKRDFPDQPEALFARFRLLQIDRAANRRLSRYALRAPMAPLRNAGSRLYEKILKLYPKHPIAREVALDYMRLMMERGRIINALEIAQDFLDNNPKSPAASRFVEEGERAIRALDKAAAMDTAHLERTVSSARVFLERHPRSVFAQDLRPAIERIWLRLAAGLLRKRDYPGAMEQAWSLLSFAGGSGPAEARRVAGEALIAYDKDLLEKGDYLGLLDFHYDHKDEISRMPLADHHLFLAEAWRKLNCPRAALRSFYRAWSIGPPRAHLAELVGQWAQTALDIGDEETAGIVLSLAGPAEDPSIMELRALVAASQGKWPRAKEISQGLLERLRDGDKARSLPAKRLLFLSCVKLAEWKQATRIWHEMEGRLDTGEKIRLLRQWGDTALELMDYPAAADAYGMLAALAPGRPGVLWRVALALMNAGDKATAMEDLKVIVQGKKEPWCSAAKAVLQNESFWQGPAGLFRQAKAYPKM